MWRAGRAEFENPRTHHHEDFRAGLGFHIWEFPLLGRSLLLWATGSFPVGCLTSTHPARCTGDCVGDLNESDLQGGWPPPRLLFSPHYPSQTMFPQTYPSPLVREVFARYRRTGSNPRTISVRSISRVFPLTSTMSPQTLLCRL